MAALPWLAGRWSRHPSDVQFTPTSTSWLNLVERWFVELTEKQLRRGAHRRTCQLVEAIERYLAVTNETAKPFVSTTAEEILASVARVGSRLSIVRFPDMVDVGREVPIRVAPLEQRFAVSSAAVPGAEHRTSSPSKAPGRRA